MANFPQTQVSAIKLGGGVDSVSPMLSGQDGTCLAAQNYELGMYGGYSRVDGYERFDGRTAPSSAKYHTLAYTSSGVISVGDTITGATSAATAYVLQVNTGELIITALTGNFVAGENITVSAIVKGVTLGAQQVSGSLSTADDMTYTKLAADYYRTFITAVTGSGSILGLWYYNNNLYAVRNAVDGLSANIWKSTSSGWTQITLKQQMPIAIWQALPIDDTAIIGITSGATSTIRRALRRTGSYGTTATGSCVLDAPTGVFQNNEVIKAISGQEVTVTSATPAVVTTTQTVTMTIASPCVVSLTAHGFVANQQIRFSTTGALPSGIIPAQVYYVMATGLTANTFQISSSINGTAINTSGTQSGTHSVNPYMPADTAIVFSGTAVPTGVTAGTVYYVIGTGLTNATFQFSLTLGGTAVNTTGTGTAVKITKAYGTVGGVSTPIVIKPNGKYETVQYNFAGQSNTYRVYGCDSVNNAFEFDGSLYVPIRTGMDEDNPSHIAGYKNSLFLSYKASLQFSSAGMPYTWSPIQGAGEIAAGDDITGINSLLGQSLAVYTKNTTLALTGASSASWAVNIVAPTTGGLVGSMQQVGIGLAIDTRGVVQLAASQAYGDFNFATISRKVQNLFDANRANFVTSTINKSKNQYRLFFNDGYGMFFTFEGEQLVGIMPVKFLVAPTVACVGENTTEGVSFFGSSTGMVYQLDKGTSFDGSAIEAYLRVRFANIGSPRIRKRFRKLVLEVIPRQASTIKLNVDYNYGDNDIAIHRVDTVNAIGGGGFWDLSNWNAFTWDSGVASVTEMSLDGTASNISLYAYSNESKEPPHTIDNVLFHYTPRRLQR